MAYDTSIGTAFSAASAISYATASSCTARDSITPPASSARMGVSGDRVIVRGEVSGTPAGDLFGVPHTGKSFRIMAVDIQTLRDGKIAKTYDLENWLSALGQLRAR
jgi:hypothetical protein